MSGAPCAAFFRDGAVVESLLEHSRRAIEAAESIFLARGSHVFIARAFGTDVGRGELAVKLAVALHDVGKGDCAFQDRKRGFVGHELISAKLIAEAVRLPSPLLEAVAAAVALHHHTMVGREVERRTFRLRDACVEELVALLAELGVSAYVDLERLTREVSHDEVRRWWGGLRKEMAALFGERPAMASGFMRLLYIVVVSDNVAAASRGGPGTALGRRLRRMFMVEPRASF